MLIAWLLAPTAAGAADEAQALAGVRGDAPPAPVVFANRTIVVLRATVLGHPPEERAEGARQRIAHALEKGGEGIVTSRMIPQGVVIEIDGATVFSLTPADVNQPAGDTLESTADRAVRLLGMAVKETREQLDPWRLLKAAGLAALATLIYAALLYGIIAANRRLSIWLSAAVRATVEKLKVAGVSALQPGQTLNLVRRAVVVLAWLLALLATHVWLSSTLQLFPYTRPWGEQLGDYLVGLLMSMLREMLGAVPGLVTVVVIFAITRAISYVIGGFFHRIQVQHIRVAWLDEDTAKPTQRLITLLLWVFAVAMAYPYLPGAQTDAFKGLSVLVGLMVSIGASSLVGQAASGMILMYSRVLRVGEFVRIADTEGTVTELGLFATRIQTGTGEDVVLPNAFVVANTTRNYSRAVSGPGFVLQVKVTIGYSTPWRQVHAMLIEAARRTSGILPDPPPYVIQSALSDFYVEYKLIACAQHSAPAQRALAINDLNANVQDVFNEYGVQIMSPHYLGDPARPHVVPKEHWFEPPARKPQP